MDQALQAADFAQLEPIPMRQVAGGINFRSNSPAAGYRMIFSCGMLFVMIPACAKQGNG